MSSERELDEGILSIKSAWRREHTARVNLEKMLEQAEAERKQGAERCAKTFEVGKRWMAKAARFESENTKLRELVRDYHRFADAMCAERDCDGCSQRDDGACERGVLTSQECVLGVEVNE